MLTLIIIVLISFILLLLMFIFHREKCLHQFEKQKKKSLTEQKNLLSFLDRFIQGIIKYHHDKEWIGVVTVEITELIDLGGLCVYRIDKECLYQEGVSGEFPEQILSDHIPSPLKECFSSIEQAKPVPLNTNNPIAQVAVTGKCIIWQEADPGEIEKKIHPFGIFPISIDKQCFGVLCALNKKDKGFSFSQYDILLLEMLSKLLGLGHILMEGYHDVIEKQRIHHELMLTQMIQKTLLPQYAPQSNDFRIHAVSKAAAEVSGDFYDFIEINDQYLSVVLADASGKGIPACLLTAMCRSFLRINAMRYKEDLESLLKSLNQALYNDISDSQFITLSCCLIDKKDLTVEYVRAGHTQLLLRDPKGEIQEIMPNGPALGLLPNELDVAFDTYSFLWQPGYSLMLFTDGLTEAINPEGEEYGKTRLMQAWQRVDSDPHVAVDRIIESVHDFTGTSVQKDDISLIILERHKEAIT